MGKLPRWVWVIISLVIASCVCSLLPMAGRYFSEDRNAFSFMRPREIIAILETKLEANEISFEELQVILADYEVTSCREAVVGVCVRCDIPYASISPFEFNLEAWWTLNTFYWKHDITISLQPFGERRVSISTFVSNFSPQWYMRSDYNSVCGGDDVNEVTDYFPPR